MNHNNESSSPRIRRLERERKNRRNDIINIAEQFFLTHGYDQAMVDQIALKAGYSKATIYNYFDSKDDLFIAVVSRAFEKLYQIMTNTTNKKSGLRMLGDAYLTFVEQFPHYADLFDSGRLSLVIGKIILKEETNEPLSESETEFRNHQLNIERLMMEVITATLKDADLQTDLNPFSVVMALSTLGTAINELVMRGKRSNQSEDKSKEYLNVLFNIIEKGLKHYDD